MFQETWYICRPQLLTAVYIPAIKNSAPQPPQCHLPVVKMNTRKEAKRSLGTQNRHLKLCLPKIMHFASQRNVSRYISGSMASKIRWGNRKRVNRRFQGKITTASSQVTSYITCKQKRKQNLSTSPRKKSTAVWGPFWRSNKLNLS